MALLAVELRRLWARRSIRVLAAVLAISVLAAPPLVDWAFQERARIERDADVERCVADEPPKVRDGVVMPTIPDDVTAPHERDVLCGRAVPVADGAFRMADVGDVLRPVGALLVAAAFAVGTSAVGADWQAGFLPVLLTWEARRRRVFAAKLLAVTSTVLVAVVAWQAVLTTVLVPFAEPRRPGDAAWLAETIGLGWRTAVVAAGAAAFGVALGFIGRGTAAALGTGLGYVLVFEGLLSTNFKPLRGWLVLDNAIVFVKGQYEGGPGGDVPGRTVTAAGVILCGYLAAVLLASAARFGRQDLS